MNIQDSIAVITGAGGGIGRSVAVELARRGAKMIALVDQSAEALEGAKAMVPPGKTAIETFQGDTTDEKFRAGVFDAVCAQYGVPNICVPAAGITRDSIAVKLNRETREPEIYPMETFRKVVDVDLIAPVYWGLEMLARIAKTRSAQGLKRWQPEEGGQGAIVFIGSVSSAGIKGQVAYSASKAGLEGASNTLAKEANFFGVRCGVIHPGFTDTPMVRALGEEYIRAHILPHTQLGRLIQPEEIADAVCFMISNPVVTRELWADAGWRAAPV